MQVAVFLPDACYGDGDDDAEKKLGENSFVTETAASWNSEPVTGESFYLTYSMRFKRVISES